MVVITRSGALVRATPEIKTALRVRPLANDDFGFPPPAFNVYRKASDGKVCVPRYFDWGSERVTEDKRPDPTRVAVRFTGRLRASTNQLEAYDSALRAGHGILALPCGFGKTVLALALSARLGYRTMIIVHKEFLANQWRERIAEFCPGARVGVVQQNKKEIDGCDYVIAMLQSLSMKEYSFSDFDSIGTVVIDEAHHICARTFSQSLFKLCPRHIFGLSATPERKDGLTRVLKWFCGDTVYSAERKAQKGVEVYNVSFDHSSFRDPPPTMRNGKVSLSTMITSLTEIRERNARLVEIVREASRGTRKVLVLSDRRRHCEFLAQCFPIDSGLYMGGMKAHELRESSTKKIIIATYSLAHEGLDIPALDTVVLSTPKSDIVQSIGRIMRETKGKKNNPRIYDFKDEWGLLGAMHWKRLKAPRYIKTISEQDPTIVIPAHGDIINALWFEGDHIATKLFVGSTIDLYVGGVKVDSVKYEFLTDVFTCYLADTWTKSQEINNKVSQTTEGFVPMQFFFCQPKAFFPLLACQFHTMEVRVTFDGAQLATLTAAEKQAKCYGNFCFLDTSERAAILAKPQMDFVIRQVQTFDTNLDTVSDNTNPGGDNSVDLGPLRHPVTSLFWGYRASTNDAVNDRFTFKQADLLLNGVPIWEKMSPMYFHTVQTYYHSPYGIIQWDDENQTPYYTRYYAYHFCVDPTKLESSASVNFSRLDHSKLVLTGCEAGSDRPSNQGLTVFAINFQILRVKDGLCGVLFGS